MKASEFLWDQILINGPIDWDLYYPEEFVYTPQNVLSAAPFSGSTPGTDQGNIQINSDAPFVLLSIGADVNPSYGGAYPWQDIAPATSIPYPPTHFIPDARVQLVDGGNSQNFFNQALPIRSLCGESGADRRPLAAPRILAANTQTTIQLLNYDPHFTMNVFFTLWGVKIKPRAIPVSIMMRDREQEMIRRIAHNGG